MSNTKNLIENSEIKNFVDEHLSFENHTFNSSLESLKLEVALGKSIYDLARAIKLSLIIDIQETDLLSQTSGSFKGFFRSTLLKNSHVQKLIYVNPECKERLFPKRSNTQNFYIILARASTVNFAKLIIDLVDLLPGNFEKRGPLSYKTLLHNYVYSKGIESPQYDTNYIDKDVTYQSDVVSTCYVLNQYFQGKGGTQAESEEAAAYEASTQLKIRPKQIKSFDHDFTINKIYESKREYQNKNICTVFNISQGKNLAQAFIPKNLIEQNGYKERNQEGLSIIGRFYIEYLKNLTALKLSQKELLTPYNLSSLNSIASISDILFSIFKTELINKSDFLFINNQNFESLEYQVNCIYSLFALGFLESTYISRKPYSSLAKNFIVDKLNYLLQSKTTLRVDKDDAQDSKLKETPFKNNNSDLNHYYQNTESKLDSKFKTPNIRNVDSSANSLNILNNTSNILENVRKKYQDLNTSELERIWLNRNSEFDFIEEASIVLSLLRYVKGIDSHLLPYQHFNNQEMILELELPSIFEYIDEPNKEKESLKNDQEPNSKFQMIAEKETTINSNQKKELEHSSLKNNHESFVPSIDDERYFITATVAYRAGQSNFRAKLIEKWGCCNITGCRTVAALDAAHIIPYRGEKDNDIRNGLLLRADIHRLFDAYQIGIEPESLKIYVSPLIDDPMYQAYHGKKLNIVSSSQISIAALKHHWSEFVSKNNIT